VVLSFLKEAQDHRRIIMGDSTRAEIIGVPPDDEDDSEFERGYIEGERRVYMSLLRECLNHLGEEENDKHRWVLERQEAISRLRELCAEFGDNDWKDNLHLADIIEKHLGDYLKD
jgi:hypothetical protein